MPRSLRPLAVLGVLTLLAAGAVVLGLFQAPKTPNLVVHNGAGEAILAKQLTIVFTTPATTQREAIDYQAPQTAVVRIYNGSTVLRRTVVRSPQVPVQIFQPFRELQTVNNFQAAPANRFVGTFPAADLVPPNERAFVTGTVHATATVTNGYVVRLRLVATLTTPAGTSSGEQTYCVSRIDGSRVQVC